MNLGPLKPNRLTLYLMCSLLIFFSIAYSAISNKVIAENTIESVPKSLIPIYEKFNILPSNKVTVTLTSANYNMDKVPISVKSTLSGKQSIVLLVLENTFPLAATFDINHPGIDTIQTKIRMQKNGYIVALVNTKNQIYANSIYVERR